MDLFDEKIVSTLRDCMLGKNEFVDSILLASYGFGIQFCDVSIHCNERVFARIGGSDYEWNDAPSTAPWGALGRQKVSDILLSSARRIRIVFESGDYLEIETVEGKYESVVINLPPAGDEVKMDIY